MKPKEPIPQFKSYEEEAEFWDTHDIADYWDDFEPVTVKFTKPLSKQLAIRVDEQTYNQLQKEAEEIGVGATTLGRIWILERLKAKRAEHNRSTQNTR